MNEFELIERYFDFGSQEPGVTVGIGDDAAIVSVPEGFELVVSVDTQIVGRHFPENFDPDVIGYRALAVNLSDMAAMGARPRWMTLSLSLPEADESWLEQFATGLRRLAAKHQVSLIGGDTVKGPLGITIQIMGLIKLGDAILRSTAQPGDHVYVTGTLGCAALAVEQLLGFDTIDESCFERFARPQARLKVGQDLVGVASSAIDISDGVLADLGHIAKASQVGIHLDLDRLPIAPNLRGLVGDERALALASTGGDDYELCFTMAPALVDKLRELSAAWDATVTRIGRVEKGEIVMCYLDGNPVFPAHSGFDHFAEDG